MYFRVEIGIMDIICIIGEYISLIKIEYIEIFYLLLYNFDSKY